ncbi:MAG: DUF4136 domain-containing protein [Steroidobacteraceae bacterium]
MKSMLRWLLAAVIFAPLAPPVSAASDISFAAGTDFRSLRTFAIREGGIVSDKLEISNRLFRQRLHASIRAALLKKGLRETPDKPDVWVTYSVTDKDVRAVARMGQTRIRGGRGAPDVVLQGPPATPVLYTEGVLVIDISNASNSLLWRGTLEDRAASAPQLSKQLSEDASKLLAKYPPGRK